LGNKLLVCGWQWKRYGTEKSVLYLGLPTPALEKRKNDESQGDSILTFLFRQECPPS